MLSARRLPTSSRRPPRLDPVFSNNFALPVLTITKLYRLRWQIELFFKRIKQQWSCEIPGDRAWSFAHADTLRCRAGSRDRSAVRRPCRGTGLDKRTT